MTWPSLKGTYARLHLHRGLDVTSQCEIGFTIAPRHQGLNQIQDTVMGFEMVRALAWDGSPEPYLDLISPYSVPGSPLAE